jgi:hypothetical protein
MTAIKEIESIQYATSTLKRAERALTCSPFRLNLFIAMQNSSVPLGAIAVSHGVEQGYTVKPLSEARIESHLMWLISVGLLRREVDGQGITDSFRLTPLGRKLVEKWKGQGELPKPTLLARLKNSLTRWLRLPI